MVKIIIGVVLLLASITETYAEQKQLIYQLFVRTFSSTGNTRETTGTFNAINDRAIDGIKSLGISTVWLTGVIEHATPYYDDPDIIKGSAGSPYAIRDFYDVNKEMGSLQDFKRLVERFHAKGLKVVIDLVANHSARTVVGDVPGKENMSFGIGDDPSVFFDVNNNYYYIKPDAKFIPPFRQETFQVPGFTYDGMYDRDLFVPGIQYEYPAKVSGNDILVAHPDFNTWFETVKLNFGFDFRHGGGHMYPSNPFSVPFTQLPDTWKKMIDIINYWLDMGVDGFRCDIANMVPVAFWKAAFYYARLNHPQAIFLMEAYESDNNDPVGYSHNQMFQAGADQIYSQPVYDAAKAVFQSDGDAYEIGVKVDKLLSKMPSNFNGKYVFYIENHDQIRSASRFFNNGKSSISPGFLISKFMFGLPGDFMIYNGQEVGETGDGKDGFDGDDGKTTIFDYYKMPLLSGWVNAGKYDGGGLSEESRKLRNEYKRLFSIKDSPAFNAPHGRRSISYVNLNFLNESPRLRKYVSSYARFYGDDRYIVVANFDSQSSHEVTIHLTSDWQDITGVLSGMGINNSQNENWCVYDVFTGFKPSDPNLVKPGVIPGSVLWRPYGIPSGIYLGNVPPQTVYYLKLEQCS